MNIWTRLNIGTGTPAVARKRLAILTLLIVGTLVSARTTRAAGRYYTVDYPASTGTNGIRLASTFTIWIPDGVSRLRGVVVHQHGAGMTASKEGSTAAYDLHWQALAKKWDCALLGPCSHVLNDGDLGPARKHVYTIIGINSAGVPSQPSAEAVIAP